MPWSLLRCLGTQADVRAYYDETGQGGPPSYRSMAFDIAHTRY